MSEGTPLTNAEKYTTSGTFKKGHKFHPRKQPLNGSSEYERLKKQFIRELKKEYGPELTFKQKAHIISAAGIMARLQLEGKDISHADYRELNTELRHGLEALGEGWRDEKRKRARNPAGRRALITAFKNVGDQQKFDKWAKTHLTLLYSMCMKLVPNVAQVAASVDTHINVNVTEDEARQKLLSAFTALVESRRDDERATRGAGRRPLEQVTYTRVDEAETRAADPSARDARPATPDATPSSTVDDPSVQNKNSQNPESEGSPLGRGLRSRSTASVVQPVTAAPREPTATEAFYDYYNSGGGHWTRWDNNQWPKSIPSLARCDARPVARKKDPFQKPKEIWKMYIPNEEPIEPQQPEQPTRIYVDALVFELAQAIADLTKVVDYIGATKTLPHAEAAANERLHDFVRKIQG
jgi:hypothetical protein